MDFSGIETSKCYDRPWLARERSCASYQAIPRGVSTRANDKVIILFVTRTKQESLPQDPDYLSGDRLHPEGEDPRGGGDRILKAARNGHAMHLFCRDIQHTAFEYMGVVRLLDARFQRDKPSEFVFQLVDDQSPADDLKLHAPEVKLLTETEQEAVVQSRLGHGACEISSGASRSGRRNFVTLRAGCWLPHGQGTAALVLPIRLCVWRLCCSMPK